MVADNGKQAGFAADSTLVCRRTVAARTGYVQTSADTLVVKSSQNQGASLPRAGAVRDVPDTKTEESPSVDATLNPTAGHDHKPVKLSSLAWAAIAFAVVAVGMLIAQSGGGHGGEHSDAHGGHAHPPAMWSIIPFVGILLCIAVLPLISATEHWWESNKNRLMVSLIFGSITLTYYLLTYGTGKVVSVLEHAILAEYIPFIVLLFALYVISGGISLKGDLAAHPGTNTGFLAIGALIASFIGTTGASMLLIRPLLQTNAERKHKVHTVVFFIFLVSNIGGCLLPIGDPPLFLGYLKGVPFLWTLGLWKEWATMCAVLLVVYFIWDTKVYKTETVRDIIRDETQVTKLKLSGKVNFIFLLGIVFCVAIVKPGEPFLGTGFITFPFMRELLMLVLVAASLKWTSKKIRKDNEFNYHAILEVAALFIGIFICMQAPIEILNASGEALAPYLSSPHAFYWATGALSGFLDNAPTYVVFFETGKTMADPAAADVLTLPHGAAIQIPTLIAVSLGSVFMGAMTYIGNGPNFMVKSIAEQSGVKMPSFFGYMIYSVCILIPLFLVVTMIFL
jgi:Na+/H+ antiporter NhaD/arsenite permease-like protein